MRRTPYNPGLMYLLAFLAYLLLFLGVVLVVSAYASASECLSENQARQTWPTSHLWWRYSHHHHGDRRCWFARDDHKRGVPASHAAGLHLAAQTAEVSGPRKPPTPHPAPPRSPVPYRIVHVPEFDRANARDEIADAIADAAAFDDRFNPTNNAHISMASVIPVSVSYVKAYSPWVDTFNARWQPLLSLIIFSGSDTYETLRRELERRVK